MSGFGVQLANRRRRPDRQLSVLCGDRFLALLQRLDDCLTGIVFVGKKGPIQERMFLIPKIMLFQEPLRENVLISSCLSSERF